MTFESMSICYLSSVQKNNQGKVSSELFIIEICPIFSDLDLTT